MKITIVLAIFLAPCLARAESAATWVLERSTLTYHVAHPLHHVEGVSHAARGKGNCREGWCDFLVGAPLKTFDSGDTNRDLHMIQVTRGAAFPLVLVRVRLAEKLLKGPILDSKLDIEFAGHKASYEHVRLRRADQGGMARITGEIPLNIADFKIDPPSLLTVPIKLRVPLDVDMIWRRPSLDR